MTRAINKFEAFAQASALDELYGLGFDFRKTREQRIRSITLDEVREVARRRFASPGRVIATVHPPAAAVGASPSNSPQQPPKEQ